MSSYLKAVTHDWFAMSVGGASVVYAALGDIQGTVFFAAAVVTSYRFWQRDHPRADFIELARLFTAGRQLLQTCQEETAPPPERAASRWEREVESCLRAGFGESHVHLFRSWSGLQVPENPIASAPHRSLWTIIHARLMRLEQFLEEAEQG